MLRKGTSLPAEVINNEHGTKTNKQTNKPNQYWNGYKSNPKLEGLIKFKFNKNAQSLQEIFLKNDYSSSNFNNWNN